MKHGGNDAGMGGCARGNAENFFGRHAQIKKRREKQIQAINEIGSKKQFEVWIEGSDIPAGTIYAYSFSLACMKLLGDRLDQNEDGSLKLDKKGRPSVGGQRCYEKH